MIDFFEIWLNSALNERHDAKMLRRYARKHTASADMFLDRASRAYRRAMDDLARARNFRSQNHANG